MSSKVQDRRERLLEHVRAAGRVRLSVLARALGVSPVTVRRDVEEMARGGLLDRSHGEVCWPPGAQPGAAAAERAEEPAGPLFGLLAPNAGYYFSAIIRGAREAAAEHGARLVLGFGGNVEERDREEVRLLVESGVEGLLVAPGWIAGSETAGRSPWLADQSVPVVVMERRADPAGPLAELDRVSSDHAHGVLLALRHLTGLGHRGIALVSRYDSPTAKAVQDGWERARRLLGLPDGALTFAEHPEGEPASFEAAQARLHAAVRAGEVTAVLVHNDVSGIAVVRGAVAAGLRVPEDLAVIAYDDEVAALADIPLTAVSPPKWASGHGAVELLLRRVREGDAFPRQHVDLLPRLVVRESCGGAGIDRNVAV